MALHQGMAFIDLKELQPHVAPHDCQGPCPSSLSPLLRGLSVTSIGLT
jgi:hypothetical protein